jgi:hypothetical protein
MKLLARHFSLLFIRLQGRSRLRSYWENRKTNQGAHHGRKS